MKYQRFGRKKSCNMTTIQVRQIAKTFAQLNSNRVLFISKIQLYCRLYNSFLLFFFIKFVHSSSYDWCVCFHANFFLAQIAKCEILRGRIYLSNSRRRRIFIITFNRLSCFLFHLLLRCISYQI